MTDAGVVVWFTGRPSAGKSTLARRAAERLRALGRTVALLDGDELRQALVPKPGYDAASRDAFYATLASLAALLARQGLTVLVAATAHRTAYRDRARELVPRLIEVFVDVSVEECRARDAKGLYRAQAQGAVKGVPGADTDYEEPLAPDVRAAGGHDDASITALCALLSP